MEFNYLVEKKRMLDNLGRKTGKCFGVDCSICPLGICNNGVNIGCNVFETEHPLEATEIVRKWAEEHPIETRKDVLLEKFPNAELDNDGMPMVCAKFLGFIAPKASCIGVNCKDCWDTEVEE